MSPVGAKGVSRSNYFGAKLVSSNVSTEQEDQLLVENVGKQHVYVFGNDDMYETENSAIELSELRPRRARGSEDGFPVAKKCSGTGKSHFVEKRVLEGDSLASIALQYGCTISEIKQANNIYNNQDFFACGKVKIPVHKFSSLLSDPNCKDSLGKGKNPLRKLVVPNFISEDSGSRHADLCLPQQCNGHSPSESSVDDSDASTGVIDTSFDDLNSTRTVSIGTSLNGSSEGLEDFLVHMDKDIMSICNKVETKKENLDEVINTLTVKCVHPMYSIHQTEKPPKLGSVGGVTWKGVVVCFVVVAVICPLLLFYFKFYKKS